MSGFRGAGSSAHQRRFEGYSGFVPPDEWRGAGRPARASAKALVQEMGAAVFIVNSYMLFSEPKDHPDSLPDVLKAKNIQHESESHSRAIDLDDDNHHDALGDDTTHEDEVKEDDEEDADDHCLEGSPHGDQDQDGGSVDELKEAVTDGVLEQEHMAAEEHSCSWEREEQREDERCWEEQGQEERRERFEAEQRRAAWEAECRVEDRCRQEAAEELHAEQNTQ
ncbi:hypothetical protein BDK51DRAFT_48281 [Blyttiomyces helicus]|uniref:Uncharacterized protein n=1 Tax=Blyttiomyces helicus TaxID=388810 RepID=A0A4P9WJH7_9FUNG|nr:hypothetical protein BDK51DRAFT_48281 [Blyttiomyces helicus]|eukprot:RKO90776.1 hypothetical protein BDK51DRAFT_48281 [Blyttiomyces helicus]